MIIMRYLIIILFSLFNFFSYAQWEDECGTILTEENARFMEKTREERDRMRELLQEYRGPAEVLPVQIHIIKQSATVTNPDDPTDQEINDMMVKLNEDFNQVGFVFIECNDRHEIYAEEEYGDIIENIYPDFIHNTFNVAHDFFGAYTQTIPGEVLNSVINIFIIPNLLEWTGGQNYKSLNGYGSFPGGRAYILLDSDHLTNSVPAHEMGHVFNLYHTYERNTGNKDNPNSETVTECGEGLGDDLCDTPADPHGICRFSGNCYNDPNGVVYNLRDCTSEPACALVPNSDCTSFKDRNSDDYAPEPNNLMSFGPLECRSSFSPQQIQRMRIALYAFRTDLIENTCAGECAQFYYLSGNLYQGTTWEYEAEEYIISARTVLAETVSSPSSNVTYDAGRYICLNPGFHAEYTSNFFAVIDGCGGEYKIGKALNQRDLSNFPFVIQPNPFSEQCNIIFELKENQAVTISVSHIMGKKITTIANNEQKVAGKHQVNFDGSDLPTGIYYCTIQMGDQIESQKMVITN